MTDYKDIKRIPIVAADVPNIDASKITTGTLSTSRYADNNTTYSVQDGELSENNFTDADHTKLNGIETSATADQTKTDIEGLGIDLPAANLTGTIADARIPSTALNSGVMTKSTSEPTSSTNPPGGVGTVWLRTTTGEMYCCTDATTDANTWTNIGAGSGNIVVSYDIDYLVIAGGGGGGGTGVNGGGGGGAGGYRNSYNDEMSGGGNSGGESAIELTGGTEYTITVGGGGAGGSTGVIGEVSSFTGSDITDITTVGGGAGATTGVGGSGGDGGTGGSGGGAGRDAGASSEGSGTANQGFDGGDSGGNTASSAGGGGGAGAVGYDGTTPDGLGDPYTTGQTPSNGGAGLSSDITGSSVARAGGGGGSWERSDGAGQQPPGGSGGGGSGTTTTTENASTAGSTNTGSGGGGGKATVAGSAGGSGVVILRMLTTDYSETYVGAETPVVDGDYTILIFNGDGSYTA